MRTLALILAFAAFPATAKVQTEITLYRNAQVPLQGYASGAWHWPGVAMSASMSLLYSHLDLQIDSCRWAFSWTPDAGPSPTGIRLVSVLNGQITPLETVLMPNRTTPTSDGRDVTNKVRSLISAGNPVWLGVQTVGDSVRGPKVYHSVLECIWESK
jgi:hypothetical protein